MEELAAHWRTAAFKHGAALMLWPWALCFLAGCYYVTHSLPLLATVSCRGRETEMMAGILKKTHSIYLTGCSEQQLSADLRTIVGTPAQRF